MLALAIICLHDLVMGFSSFPSGGRGGLCGDPLSGGQSCSPVTFATSPCKLMTGDCKTLHSIKELRSFDGSISKPTKRGDPDACWMMKDDFHCNVAYMERKDGDGTVLGYSVCESRTLGNGKCVCRAKTDYYCSLGCAAAATSSLDRCQEVQI